MVLTVVNLGNGQLPSSQGALYTVPAATKAIVTSVILTNTNTSASELVSLWYLKSGGTARALISNYTIPVNGSALGCTFVFDTKITMGTGDAIEGVAADASKVDYVINGWQES